MLVVSAEITITLAHTGVKDLNKPLNKFKLSV